MDTLQKTPAIIDGATNLLNEASLKSYSSAITGLSEKQALLALSTKNLTDAQKEQILVNAGIAGSNQRISLSQATEALSTSKLSEETQKQILSQMGLVDANGVYIALTKDKIEKNLEDAITTGAISKADKEAAIAALEAALGTGVEAGAREGLVGVMAKQLAMQLKLIATNPVTWIVLVIAGLVAATKAYAKFTTSANEASEAFSNSLTEYQNQVKSVREQKDTIDQLSDSYEKLSKGVNTVTNENLSLNTDDYKEYLDTCNQIADMYPELVTGYDAQGNAILSLKGNVEGLTEAYKVAQQEAYATAYLGVIDEDGKYSGGFSSAEKEFKYSTDYIDPGDDWWDRNKFTKNEQLDKLKELQNMSVEEFRQTGFTYAEALRGAGINITDLLDATATEYQSQINAAINNIVNTQESSVSDVKSALEGYMKGVTDAGGTTLKSGYDKLTEKQQNLATSILSSIDESIIASFENSTDPQGEAEKWVNNIVSSISTMSAEAKNAYDELQDSIANPSDLTSAGINKIDGYLNTLSDELGVTKDKLKDILNLDDVFDTQSSFEKNIDKYLGKGGYDKLISQAEKGVDSAQAYKDAMETANKTLREQNQQEAKELQKQQDEQEKLRKQSQKDHASAMDTANATMRNQRQEAAKEEQKQSEESQNAHIKAMETANARLRQLNKERADESKKSEKEVADNIKQVYAERDAAVQKSMDNIEQRNKQVADNIKNSEEAQHAKALMNDVTNSVKEYDKAVSKAGKKSAYSGISDIDNNYKNSQNKVNPWKQFGQEYMKAQQEAHKNDTAITQAEVDNMNTLGNAAKSVWDSYIKSQQEAHKNDGQITKASVDNFNSMGNKLKSVWDKYTESQQEAYKNDSAIIQAQSDNAKAVGEKIKSEANSWKDTLKNDFDGSYLSGVKDNFKKVGEAFNNNSSVKYLKDTGKDVINIIGTTARLQDQVQQLSKANESAGRTASKGIGNVINSAKQLDTITSAEKERLAQAQKESQEEDKRYKLDTKKANQQSKDEAIAAKKEKEKQAQAEKTERQEKRRADATQQRIKNEISAAQKEKDAQKWISDNLNNMTVSQMKMWNEAALGADTAAQAVDNYNKLLQDNAMNTMSIDIASVTEHINNLNTALSESASATGLTADSISNLKTMFSGLEGYDSATLFMNTANGVKVNREELERLNQEYSKQNSAKAQEQLGLLQDKYNNLTDQINTCSDASQTANLYAQRDAVLDQIHDVQSLISQYDGLTSAFNEWQNAQNETSPGANYDSMYSYLETANKLAGEGKWGNPALIKYMELISGEDLSDKTPSQMKEVWDNLDKSIGNTGHNLMEFLTEDKTGIEKFIDTLGKLDKGYIQIGEDGQKILKANDMQDLADDLGTDVSYVQVLLDKLSEYGWKIEVDSTDLDLATTKAEEANNFLKKHFEGKEQFQYSFNFNAEDKDGDNALTREIDKAKELLNDPVFKDANGNFDINIEGAAEAQQILVALLARKEALQEPTIMQVDTEKLEGTNKTVISTLQNIQSTIDGYDIQFGANMDTSEMRQKVGDALDEIDKINPEIQKQLGLADGDVQRAIKTLKSNISKGVELDSDSLLTIQEALGKISPEILASLGINMNEVQKDADEVAQSFETALTNVLSNLTITVDGKEIKFNIQQPDPVKVTADTSDVDSKMMYVNEKKIEDKTAYINGDNTDAMNKTQEAEDKGEEFDGSTYQANLKTIADSIETDTLIGKLKTWFAKIGAGMYSATVSTSTSGSTPSTPSTPSTGNNSKKKNPSFKGSGGGHTLEADGSFHGFASGTNVSLPKNETALVNEVGTEGLLRNGVLTELPGGAHLEKLQKGDIIFNHLQMEQLRRYGYVTANGGHGQLIGGFAYGTLNGISGYAGTDKKKDSTGTYGVVGGVGAIVTASKTYGESKSNSKSSSSKSNSGSSSTKSSTKSSGSSNTSSSSTSDEAEKTEETLDWIETKISRVERLIKNLGNTVSATYRSWTDRNAALAQELSEVNSEISIQQQAYDRYMQQANSVGLDAGYAQLVRDGKIDIETITDEDLKQKISDYQNWFEKALACSDAVLDLRDNLYDLAKTNFDNITKQFEDQLNVIEHSVNMVEGYIDLAETRGYLASTDYYDSLIKTETQNIGTLKNEYDSLANTLNNLTNSGQIEKYSEAWYEMYSQICDVEEALQDAIKALSEYESKMRELKWSYFEKEQDYITNFTDETQWLIDLLEKQGKLVDDNGNMTNRGTASMGLHAVGYNTYMAQADDYANEILKINQQLANDPYNTILIDKRQEYLKAQRDAIDAAYDELDATKSLIKEGYDAQLDALDKLIEKRKKYIDNEKSIYDYQKSVAEKVDTISSYEKQLKAYENDNSEEGMAKRQQAEKNLKDAKTDLQETEWEQQISDVEQMMSDMRDDYEEFLNTRLDDINFILNTMLDSANQNSGDIQTTLKDATASVGTTLSDAMNSVWSSNSGLNSIVTAYGNGFNNALTTTNTALASIETMIKSMVQEAQRKAAEDAAIQAATVQAVQPQTPNVPQSNQSQNVAQATPTNGVNTNQETGFFIYKANSFPKDSLNKENSIVDFS